MTDEQKPSDDLFYALEAIQTWYPITREARDPYSSYRRPFGELFSTLLLATDEAVEVVAVTGALSPSNEGFILVIGARDFVYVDVRPISPDVFDYTVSSHSFSEIESVTVRSQHNYFDGADRPRHHRMTFDISFTGRSVAVSPTATYHAARFTTPDAVLAAFEVVRDSRR